MIPERIQKALAATGIGSRRQIEEWIQAGKIKVNGKVAVLGQKVTDSDSIMVNRRPVALATKIVTPQVIMYHKPEGQLCSRVATQDNDSVFNHLPSLAEGRWVMVGRLDLNTSGLLLFTDCGELANRLMHPRYQIKRVYLARVLGTITPDTINTLKRGVELEQGMGRFTEVKMQSTRTKDKAKANQWVECTLTEGKYREVRTLWESVGCTVSRLMRIQYGPVALPRTLKKGQCQALSTQQIKQITDIK